jgi:hypothetical protein
VPDDPAQPVLSRAELNRATLARQRLLRRERLGPVEAAAAVGGLQAQEPASPYLALWSRLEGFDADAMTAAFEDHSLVKAGLMRATLHAVPADDYLLLRPAVDPVFSVSSRLLRGARPDADRLARLRAEIEDLAATPRPNSELRDRLAELEGVADPEAREALWWWVRRTTPLLQAPTGGPWSFGRRPSMVAPEAWIGRPFGSDADGLVLLLRRYLGALGPATVGDATSWSGVTAARLRPAIETLDRAGELWRGRDERGRTLLDLAGAPRPGADVEAPPRLLPMWDGLVLGHADRTRVIRDEDRARVVAGNGDTYPTFLVDGRVSGLWWTRRGGTGPEIELEPFRRLRRADRAALEAEGARLAAFLAHREPDAYARYRGIRDRKLARTTNADPLGAAGAGATGTSD